MIAKAKFKEKILKFYLERHSDFASFYQVFIEKSYPNLMKNLLNGDTLIDAGANIGVFTVIASTLVGKKGRVISVEPDPDNLGILKKNIELNDLNNVEIIDKVLYSESKLKIKFIQDGVGSKIVTDKTDANYIEVETTTLDDIMDQREIGRSALKMDIEGGEKFALLAAEAAMKNVNFFEGEIHSREDFDALMKFSNLFSFLTEPAESLHNVFLFSIRHPLKTVELEFRNKFHTTKRILSMSCHNSKPSEYPIIVYGEKFH
jgi:FkbM family methyltransferase